MPPSMNYASTRYYTGLLQWGIEAAILYTQKHTPLHQHHTPLKLSQDTLHYISTTYHSSYITPQGRTHSTTSAPHTTQAITPQGRTHSTTSASYTTQAITPRERTHSTASAPHTTQAITPRGRTHSTASAPHTTQAIKEDLLAVKVLDTEAGSHDLPLGSCVPSTHFLHFLVHIKVCFKRSKAHFSEDLIGHKSCDQY